jgi:tRNA-Thr(GGU) m(6)t(6)A37 methyltransferase TsaA
MSELLVKSIGVIKTPFNKNEGMPIQPIGAKGVQAIIEMHAEYVEGLNDLVGFSHIILIYQFHKSNGYSLKTKPFMDDQLRGVFATRAPRRPNPIGISVVKLNKIENNIIHIENIDVLNDTPLLDIKPYIPGIDNALDVRLGWLDGKSEEMRIKISDKRFNNE